jgi:GT2 family glycosyltransferase
VKGNRPGLAEREVHTVSWVLLTMGDRPNEVALAVNGLLANQPPPAEVIVVGNGRPVEDSLFDGPVAVVELPSNQGIPGGRNAGAAAATSDVIAFLDDDATAPDRATTQNILDLFNHNPDLGAISFRIIDPVTGATQARHVPTLGGRDPGTPRPVTTFLGGACAIRRMAFVEAGGLPERFFYAHEETDLSWRLLDRGWDIRYSPEITVTHPATTPGRHEMASRLTARNRVWLARRNLPWPLAVAYVSNWLAITALRRSFPARPFLRGIWQGLRQPAGDRRPMRWSTAYRMAKLGRPPIV